MHSHHSHSGEFCSHAHPGTTLKGMLDHADALGFHTYCLSEHVPRQFDDELYPEEMEEGSTPEKLRLKFQDYLKEARRLQQVYRERKGKRSMNVLVGAETENLTPSTLRWLKDEVLHGTSNKPSEVGKGVVDYLVGSVHHAGAILPCCGRVHQPSKTGIPIDFDAATFDKAAKHFASDQDSQNKTLHLLRLCLSYFEAQYQLIDQLRPEVIGHFDLVRLFAPDLLIYGPIPENAESTERVLRQQVQQASDRNIKLAISYGALFEVNSASVRKSWKSPYPAQDVLRRIQSLGGRLCLSDDAHGPSHIAINYQESREYLRANGIETIWYLTKADDAEADEHGRPELQAEREVVVGGTSARDAPIRFARGCRAVRVELWWQDQFWDQLEERKKQTF
ncbi:unnamed protein product [Sympodiomycopsis kandeliae]